MKTIVYKKSTLVLGIAVILAALAAAAAVACWLTGRRRAGRHTEIEA